MGLFAVFLFLLFHHRQKHGAGLTIQALIPPKIDQIHLIIEQTTDKQHKIKREIFKKYSDFSRTTIYLGYAGSITTLAICGKGWEF
jgi:hypothetical protein